MKDIASIKGRTKKEIKAYAITFLEQYPQHSNIPVKIETIVDNELEINIAPLPGLRDEFDNADAFITSDFTAIYIDQFVYDYRDNRRRFTLAHEIGHMVMHREVYEKLDMRSFDTAIQSISSIPIPIRSRLEGESNEFAGHVLVPSIALTDMHPIHHTMAVDKVLLDYPGLDDIDPATHTWAVTQELIQSLSKRFEVSEITMKIRLERERLIKRYYNDAKG